MQYVVVAGGSVSGFGKFPLQIGFGPEPGFRLRCDGVEFVAARADTVGIDDDVWYIGPESAADTIYDCRVSVGNPESGDGCSHSIDRSGGRFDLARLQPDSTNLDLFVDATVVHHALSVEHANPVAGPVDHSVASRGWPQPELLCVQFGPPKVARGHSRPVDVELALNSQRHWVSGRVEHVQRDPRSVLSDRHLGHVVDTRVVAVEHATDHGFRRAVLVPDGRLGPARNTNLVGEFGHEGLSPDDETGERMAGFDHPHQQLEVRRGGLHQRDGAIVDDLSKCGEPAFGVHGHGATGNEWQEEGGDRQVETQRGVERHDGSGLADIGRECEPEVLGQPCVGDGNTLRKSGGA